MDMGQLLLYDGLHLRDLNFKTSTKIELRKCYVHGLLAIGVVEYDK